MKVKKTHNDDEIFVHSCIDFGLLNVKKMIESPNLNLIKKALNSYPIHYYEILSELVRNKEYKKLFEISVDLNESSLREAILFEKYEQLDKIVYYLSTRLNEKSGLNIIQNQNLQFAEQLLLQDKHQDESISDGKMLANHLQLCRKAIIKEVSWKIDAESLKKELTEQYFLDNLESNQDLVIIKLCLLLEAKFKIDYKLVGDLSELLTKYIRKEFYIEDDYYGRSGLRDEYIPDILQRLRIMRNNLLHSEKKNVKPLEKQELLDCIIHIIKM